MGNTAETSLDLNHLIKYKGIVIIHINTALTDSSYFDKTLVNSLHVNVGLTQHWNFLGRLGFPFILVKLHVHCCTSEVYDQQTA